MDLKEFENKSINYKTAQNQTTDTVEPVIDSTKLKIKKPSEMRKLKKNFFIEDGHTIIGTLFSSVIIPGLKKLFLDGVTTAASTALYGTKGQKNNPNNLFRNSLGNIAYGSMSAINNKQLLQPVPTTVYMVEEFIFPDITTAQVVLDSMNDILTNDGKISVNRFYDLVGYRGNNPTDTKYGWTNLFGSKIIRDGDGYKITFPKVIPLV